MDHDELDRYLRARTEQDRFSGAVSILHGQDELFAAAYGLASRTWNVANTMETKFDTASITKLFTAVLALQCVESGLLELDSQAVSCLGIEDTAIDPDVTLKHLLTHTSGIGDDAEEEDGEDYADIWKDRISYNVRSTRDLFEQFVHKPPNFPPGESCRYCNAGFILAGAMVEAVTGEVFRDLVESRIFARAGMDHSGFFAMDVVAPGVAEGADLVSGQWIRNIYSYPPIGSPDGGAHSTVRDLQRFLKAAREGRLLGPEMTELFLEPQAHHSDREPGPFHMGFGVEFQLDDAANIVHMGKDGINAGTSGFLRHYPGQELTVALLSNMADGAWEPRSMIHDMLIS